MSLKRSGTVVNGSIRSAGESGLDHERNSQIMPLNKGKTFDEWDQINKSNNNKIRDWEVARDRYINGRGPEPGSRPAGGSRHRRRSSCKYKKSSKRVFRKRSRVTRRR